MTGDLLKPDRTLTGTLQQVRFESDDGQFSVAEIDSPRGRVTVIGNLCGAVPGERLQLRGGWETDKRFGRQFRITDALALPPTSREGIVRYLSSGLIDGIGPVLAERLVDAFGEDTLDVIEGQRHRLIEVPGIGKVRQRRILQAWDKQRAIRQVMLFLSANGVSITYAFRIYETYGDDAITVVRQNPYKLARDIFGIGFKSADRIAQNLGIEPNAPARLAAGLAWTLEQAGSGGHVLLPKQMLIERASEVLEVDEVALREVLGEVLKDGTLYEEEHLLDEPVVYTRFSRNVEAELAARVADRMHAKIDRPTHERLLKAAAAAERRLGIQLEGGQRAAVERLLGRRLGILTGGPGTGKTTIVRLFADAASSLGWKVALGAPTGRAARRLSESTGREAATLHRLLRFSFAERTFTRDEDDPLEADYVVVDEASMLDQHLARALFRALGPDTSLLLVGDADQLPSVGPGNVLHDLLTLRGVGKATLTEVFRQASHSTIVSNAHRIRRGQLPERPRAQRSRALADFYHISVDTPEQARERVLELVSRRIPKAFELNPFGDIQVLAPMHRGECGITALNQALQERLNPRGKPITAGEHAFRLGDRVIQLRNNYQKEVFNGQIGLIRSLDAESGSVEVFFDGQRVSYERAEMRELSLAYCISIHKSQGSEYPAIVVPLVTQHYMMLQRNLLYTAVTRARQLVCLVGQPRAIRRAVRNADPQRRYTALAARVRAGS